MLIQINEELIVSELEIKRAYRSGTYTYIEYSGHTVMYPDEDKSLWKRLLLSCVRDAEPSD